MSYDASSSYLWSPEQGPDRVALDRMMRAFPKPATAMGETWFMAPERLMYPQLLGDLAALPDDEIMQPLEEIACGFSCFGLLPEWTEWNHYLLPRLLTRRWAPTYYQPGERLFSAFMNQHTDIERTSPYPDFRADALDTLGRYIMSPLFWPGGRLDAVNCLSKWTGPTGIAGWWRAGGLLSASLFFCAKYLPAETVDGWFRSVLAIPDRYWRLQIITWLAGAHSFLIGKTEQPADIPEIGPLDVSWDWSFAVRRDEAGPSFLPVESCAAIVRIACDMEAEAFLENVWTDPTMDAVTAELAGLPEHFLALYRSA